MKDLLVLYEHPEWQKPLFEALSRRDVSFDALDLKAAAFDASAGAEAHVVFNQASPSAYVRGNRRAVPLALAFLRMLEVRGSVVVNGARAFALELSKTAQCSLIGGLGLRTPRSIAFNDVDALAARVAAGHDVGWPALIKPEQGGSGARIHKVASIAEVRDVIAREPGIWEPDGLLLLQEYIEHDVDKGIVRMEILGGELLYAMRVLSHGRFNLCPSEVCNPVDPDDASSACEIPEEAEARPVEFYPFDEVPDAAVDGGRRILAAAGIDVGGVEYVTSSATGEPVFYDVNANSNLRPAIARLRGFDPFDRVVDHLVARIAEAKRR
jgi:hypothetical protein